VESIFSTSFPLASDLSRTLCHSDRPEGRPVGRGGLAARVRKNVDKSLAFQRIVCGRPVGDVFYPVFLEESCGVFAKAAEQVVELPS